MKATNAYAAKRALLAYLATVSPFTDTPPMQLLYARDERLIEQQSVYGGGARFVQNEEAAEGVMRFETVTAGLYVRCAVPGMDLPTAEQAAEQTADTIAQALTDHPDLTGNLTFQQIVAGSADFYLHDQLYEVILALSCTIESHLV